MRRFEQLETRLLLAADLCGHDADEDDADDDDTDEVAAEVAAKLDSVAAQAITIREAGSTIATAFDMGQLGAAQSLNGSVGGQDTRDVMRFSLAQQSQVSLGLSGLRADIDLALYNASGQLLSASNNGGSASESITATLDAGVYYVAVTPWRRAAGTYVLSAAATATVPPAVNPPATNGGRSTPVSSFADVAYYGAANEWNVNAINAPESWAHGYTGDGVVVAVVDTGVDMDHPDLVSQIWVNAGEIAGNGIDDDRNGYVDDVHGWDFSGGDNNPDDGNGHGTHVAGTIAADNNAFGATGVAPDATIMPLRVLSRNGSGTAAGVAAGIRYAAQMGADIINLSLGGALSSVIQSAIQYALSLDVLVVAAAGNESASTPGYPARFSASLSNVISVGAYTSSGAIANFSNDVGASGAVQVDAPGVNVYSTYLGGSYGRLSGTSMAAPHVAGLAALALSANASLTASQLRTLIVAGADRVISGSDARGGIDAATTVARAAAGQTSSASVAATSASPTSSLVASMRRFSVSSSADMDSSSFAPAVNAESAVSSPADIPHQLTAASVDRQNSLRAARDTALLALQAVGDDSNDPDISAADAEWDLLIDIHSHARRETVSHAPAYHIVV